MIVCCLRENVFYVYFPNVLLDLEIVIKTRDKMGKEQIFLQGEVIVQNDKYVLQERFTIEVISMLYLHGYLATAATECVARSDWCKEEYHHCEYGIHRCCDV